MRKKRKDAFSARRQWPERIPAELRGMSVADVVKRLEAGKIGHSAAMRYFNVETYHELVEIVHFNGRKMPGHMDHPIPPETMEVLRIALGKEPSEE